MDPDDIIHEDKIAIPIWSVFTLAAAAKPFVNGELHSTLQTFIGIVPALCGAYLGFRHIQSIQAYKLEKMRAEMDLEHKRLEAERCKRCETVTTGELNIMTKPTKAAGHREDTVDLK